jgi:hypothetical protein
MLGKVNGNGCRVFHLQIHLFTNFLIMGYTYVDTFVNAATCMLYVGALYRHLRV